MKPYLHELQSIQTSSPVYQRWTQYALSLAREDVLVIVENGLTYQAEALRSMVREIIGGQSVPRALIKKIDLVVAAAANKARQLG